MKKKYTILAAAALSIAVLAGCGSASTDEEAAATQATSQEETAQDTTDQQSDAAAEATTTSLIDVSGLPTKTLGDFDVDKLVKLGDYKGITLNATKKEVTDEDVENSLKTAYSYNPTMEEITDRAIEDGDIANINYEGVMKDTKEAFQGGTAENVDLNIGSGTFIEGFESGLIGSKTGDTVELNLTFPETYGNTDLAGKDVIFTVKVNGIKRKVDEPSDEWAASLGIEGVTTLDQYRAHLKEELEADAEEEYNVELMNQAIDEAVAASTVEEIPEELYNRYLKMIYNSVDEYVQQIYYTYGVQYSAEDYINTIMQSNGATGTAHEYLSAIANEQAKRSMVVQAIANKEGLKISESELDDYLKTYYDAYYAEIYPTFEEFKETVDLEDYRELLVTDDVAELLVKNDKVEEAAE